jgi:hypothetical protein
VGGKEADVASGRGTPIPVLLRFDRTSYQPACVCPLMICFSENLYSFDELLLRCLFRQPSNQSEKYLNTRTLGG